MRRIVLIIHNIRSCHNVGSLLRTADGLGVEKVYLTGYTPYPSLPNDSRLPHIAARVNKQITKTALGAEKMIKWQQQSQIVKVIKDLRRQNFTIVALEQAHNSTDIARFSPPPQTAIIVGREVEGIEPEILTTSDQIVAIPMLGGKESLNVTVAAAIALYHCRWYPYGV